VVLFLLLHASFAFVVVPVGFFNQNLTQIMSALSSKPSIQPATLLAGGQAKGKALHHLQEEPAPQAAAGMIHQKS
jgi:hypothetical protein